MGFIGDTTVKQPGCQCQRRSGRSLEWGQSNPLQYSCWQRSLAGYNLWGWKESHNWSDLASVHAQNKIEGISIRYLADKMLMLFFFYCSGFCHTLKWISHGFTCVAHPDPPSHLPLYPIPLGLPSAPGPSACLWEKARVGCFKRTASKHVYYLGWNRSPAQVGWMLMLYVSKNLCLFYILRPRGNY